MRIVGRVRERRALASLPRAVLALGAVSLLTDVSSEMIYPLLPAFVAGVLGGGPLALGLIEGVAEATSSLLKIVSGWLTDRSGRRKPLVLGGYALSGCARPLIGAAAGWPFVLACRFADRIGKGLRTSPRDALIADWVPEGRRGLAYGFHRAMDHFGAMLGPLLAAALLAAGFGYRAVFFFAGVPAAAVIVLLLVAVREKNASGAAVPTRSAAPAAPLPARRAGILLGAVLLQALGLPADVLLLQRLSVAGVSTLVLALTWSGHSLVRSASTLGAGALADRWPAARIVVLGWLLRAATLALFAVPMSQGAAIALLLVYGGVAGLTEPAEKAFVATAVGRRTRGRAFGLYHATIGIGALPASVLFGALWETAGLAAAFGAAAGLAGAAAVLLALAGRRADPAREP